MSFVEKNFPHITLCGHNTNKSDYKKTKKDKGKKSINPIRFFIVPLKKDLQVISDNPSILNKEIVKRP